MKREGIEIELREGWFKNHKARLENLSEDIAVLTWREPGTSAYGIRYVFDYNKIYITGDLGDAVLKIYGKVNLEKAANFDIYYFHKKLTATDEEKWDFNEEKAIERLMKEIEQVNERKLEYLGLDDITELSRELNAKEEEKVALLDEYIEMFEGMIDSAKECSSRSHWVQCVYSEYLDSISDYDSEFYEWIFDIGNEYPRSVQTYLIGLKMAHEQLNTKEVIS